MPLSAEERDNWAQQLDELLALASIYGEDFRLLGAEEVDGALQQGGSAEELSACEPPQGAWQLDCSITVRINPPAGRLLLRLQHEGEQPVTASLRVGAGAAATDGNQAGPAASRSRSSSAQSLRGDGSSGGAGGLSVRYLPPINLQLRLHSAYPAQQPPQLLTLTALWLTPSQAAVLVGQLQQLWWEQGPGLPICFMWVDWLQSSALQHLGAAEVLVVGSVPCGNSPAGEQPAAAAGGADATLEASSRFSSRSVGSAGSQDQGAEGEEKEEEGPGAAEEPDTPEQVLFKLLRYDAACEHREFQRAMHTCSICFEEQTGTGFVRLECRHHYCQGCLGEQCHIHVREGSLVQLKCPEPKCGAALSPQVLQRVLPPEEFARWEALTLQKTLDRMADAAYCPRCSTVSLEDADSCAQCPKCFFVFCTLCTESWHPGTQCVSAETRLAMLQRKLAGGGAMSVQELRRKEQEMMSLATIEGMSKKCPRCQMAIQKSEGCNKMSCGNCGAYFCYKCNKEIKGYDHYKSGECVLFDEAEILRWEAQWEDHVARVALGEARNDFFGQQQLAGLGRGGGAAARGGRERLRACHCPQCGQLNYKMGNNNHMNCWACTSHFCYMCRQVLRGKGGTHFGPKGCKQHTSD